MKKFFLLIVLLQPLLVFANPVADFLRFIKTTQSAQGQFQQQLFKQLPQDLSANEVFDVNAKNSSQGEFVFNRPGQFIWRTQKPYQQTLQADGKYLYVFDVDLQQVMKRPLENTLSETPAAILFGASDIEKKFQLKILNQDWLSVIPKKNDGAVQSIRIRMQKGIPTTLQIQQVSGQWLQIRLLNLIANPRLEKTQFIFKIPEGVTVLDENAV